MQNKIEKKTAVINLRIRPSDKNMLKEKALSQNLDLTGFLEKIANNPIIFLSEDIKKALEVAEKI